MAPVKSMDAALWNREKDDIATTTTPEAVSARSVRQDFRHMGMSEEPHPAAEWTSLRKPPKSAMKEVRFRSKGKGTIRPTETADSADSDISSSAYDADTQKTNVPLSSDASREDEPESIWSSAVSRRYGSSEESVTPIPTQPLMKEDEPKDRVDAADKNTAEGSERTKSRSEDSPATIARLSRKSIVVAGKKGIARILPKKKVKPQY
ncbi:hypothetical protein CLAFUW4_02413 [Fulvia fulva]|nr:hypothetical protein CLAFUR4_02408 [Fulvia fulva]KAK4633163.1 hypothetical protein CLAFUR0_02412 [Fulvia fulva]WPV10679.1 hypothetical protein CLAFUW4_02413 [Fulvia fulva]WPV25635.1 hypothetical protein CLAFUW7_02413 [Fulvia fulva]